jgi:hypothetical protein
MTQAAYALHQGVTASAVSKWKSDGLLVWAEDPDRRGRMLIDVVATDEALAAHRDPVRGRPQSGTPEIAEPPAGKPAQPVDALAQVRTDYLLAQTAQKHLQNEKLAGALVPVAEFEGRAADFGRLARERVQGVVRQHAERLAAERDPRVLSLFLAGEIDAVFALLADEIEARATPRPAGADTNLEAAGALDALADLDEAEAV